MIEFLKQIRRACEHNEVISNYERNYVRKLAEKHLGKKPEFIQTSSISKKTNSSLMLYCLKLNLCIKLKHFKQKFHDHLILNLKIKK